MSDTRKEMLEDAIEFIAYHTANIYGAIDDILAVIEKLDHDAYEDAIHSWVASIDMALENRYGVIPDRWGSLQSTLQEITEKMNDGNDGYKTLDGIEEANYIGQIEEELTVEEIEDVEKFLERLDRFDDDERVEFFGKDKTVIDVEGRR
jgi:hypothetical protein